MMFCCYRCESGGSLESLFRKLNGGFLRTEELQFIKGEAKMPDPTMGLSGAIREAVYGRTRVVEAEKLKPYSLPRENIWLYEVDWDTPPLAARNGVDYLKARGVGPSAVHRYEIGYCPTGRFGSRLLFPVRQGGEIIYFTTRYTGPHELKALTPTNQEGLFKRTDCLLNYDACVGAQTVAVVEGPFDMMAFQHAGAINGKKISDVQVRLLSSLYAQGTQEFVVALDAEAAREADALYSRLIMEVPRVTMLLLREGDPDDNKDRMDEIMAARSRPTLQSRVSKRFQGNASGNNLKRWTDKG